MFEYYFMFLYVFYYVNKILLFQYVQMKELIQN